MVVASYISLILNWLSYNWILTFLTQDFNLINAG